MNESLKQKEQEAIKRLKVFEPKDEPYYLCYSGGKDSDVIRILAQLAGVRHEIHHKSETNRNSAYQRIASGTAKSAQ